MYKGVQEGFISIQEDIQIVDTSPYKTGTIEHTWVGVAVIVYHNSHSWIRG